MGDRNRLTEKVATSTDKPPSPAGGVAVAPKGLRASLRSAPSVFGHRPGRNGRRNFARLGWRAETLGQRLLVPVLILVVAWLVLLPIGFLVYGAVTNAPPGSADIGLTFANIREFYLTNNYWASIANTFRLAIVVGVACAFLSLFMAWTVTRTDIPRRGLWTFLLIAPIYLSPLMVALAAIAVGAPRVGYLNALSRAVGGPETVLNVYGFWGITIVMIINYIPYGVLFLLGPMNAMDGSQEEAAIVMGASESKVFRSITLPIMMPAGLAVGLIVFTLAAENFSVPTLLGRVSGFNTLTSEIYYWMTYVPARPNMAAAAGALLLAITGSGLLLYRRITRIAGKYVIVGGKGVRRREVKLERWSGVAQAALGTYVFVTVVLPIGALTLASFSRYVTPTLTRDLFTLDNLRSALSGSNLDALKISLYIGVTAATICTVLGFLVPYAVRRGQGPGRKTLDYLSILTLAIPGTTLAVGMLWAYTRLAGPLWATIWILVIAYLSRFLAHAVRVTDGGMLQIAPELDEAAQMLGANTLHRFKLVYIPLLKQTLMSSWILVFVFSLNEVSATVLLYTRNTTTQSVLIWNSIQMSTPTLAFALTMVQGVIVFIVLGIGSLMAGMRPDQMMMGRAWAQSKRVQKV